MTELTEKQKSRQQEKAYHKLFGQIADHCVAHGIDLKMAMEHINKYEVAVTAEFVKSTWRAILYTQTQKTSTKDQTKEDIKGVQPDFTQLWEGITKEKIDWPSVENQYLSDLDNEQYQ
jgi:hypothetical protein